MEGTGPQEGDLVVREQSPLGPFLITPLAGPLRWETTCRTYQDAVQMAERTAHVYKSAIWFTRDGVTFDLVSSYRMSM
jgi:hypothetical protein